MNINIKGQIYVVVYKVTGCTEVWFILFHMCGLVGGSWSIIHSRSHSWTRPWHSFYNRNHLCHRSSFHDQNAHMFWSQLASLKTKKLKNTSLDFFKLSWSWQNVLRQLHFKALVTSSPACPPDARVPPSPARLAAHSLSNKIKIKVFTTDYVRFFLASWVGNVFITNIFIPLNKEI